MEFIFISELNSNISITIKAINYHEAVEVLNVVAKDPSQFKTK